MGGGRLLLSTKYPSNSNPDVFVVSNKRVPCRLFLLWHFLEKIGTSSIKAGEGRPWNHGDLTGQASLPHVMFFQLSFSYETTGPKLQRASEAWRGMGGVISAYNALQIGNPLPILRDILHTLPKEGVQRVECSRLAWSVPGLSGVLPACLECSHLICCCLHLPGSQQLPPAIAPES